MNKTRMSLMDENMSVFMNRSTATIIAEVSTLSLLGVMAFVGNLLVAISIYRNQSLRTATNYLILSLSSTGILMPVIGLPFTLIWCVKSRFMFDEIVCEYQACITFILLLISVIMMVLMALNRFVRVCKPQKYNHYFNKPRTFAMIGWVWLGSVVGVVTVLKGAQDLHYTTFRPNLIMCSFSYLENNVPAMILGNLVLVVFNSIPFMIICFCYYQVFKQIRHHKNSVGPSITSGSPGTSLQEIKITWILFAVVLGYLVTWIPVLFVTIANNITPGSLPRQVNIITTYCAIGSCALNPIIYGALNKAFRREYTRILKCK